MSQSITDNNKKRGRGRPKVNSTFVGVRLPPDQLAQLDEWLSQQPEALSRPAAIRKIINEYLISVGLIPWEEEAE